MFRGRRRIRNKRCIWATEVYDILCCSTKQAYRRVDELMPAQHFGSGNGSSLQREWAGLFRCGETQLRTLHSIIPAKRREECEVRYVRFLSTMYFNTDSGS